MRLLRNRTVLGVLCILLSLAICFGITPLFNSAVSEKTTIVRVISDIKTGDAITAEMLEEVEVGGYNLPENVIRTAETAVSSFALADFAVGDYILNTKVSETMQTENAYLYNLNGEQQAMSVTIKTFANGLSGKLQSGDIVSVISPNHLEQGITVIPPELKYVEVISVTADTGADANTGQLPSSADQEDDERELPSTVTLLVTAEQSKLLAELESIGEMHLSLVYRGDTENAQKFLDAQAVVLSELAEQTANVGESE